MNYRKILRCGFEVSEIGLGCEHLENKDKALVLDTDNLMAYFTEDLEELFKDDAYIKCKKSKIFFLLDGSGSMDGRLLDKQMRIDVVTKCVTRIIRILKEVQATEGINIDWDVAKFEGGGCKMLSKNDWQKEYYPGGGTALSYAFQQAIGILERDFTVDGNERHLGQWDAHLRQNLAERGGFAQRDFQRVFASGHVEGDVSASVEFQSGNSIFGSPLPLGEGPGVRDWGRVLTRVASQSPSPTPIGAVFRGWGCRFAPPSPFSGTGWSMIARILRAAWLPLAARRFPGR